MRFSFLPVLVAAGTVVAAAQTTPAPVRTPQQAIERLFTSPTLQEAWFAPSFLAQVPFGVLNAQLAPVRTALGRFVRLDTLNGRPLAVFERGTLIVTVATVDAQGRFTAFGAAPGPVPAAQAATVTDVLTRVFRSATVDTTLFAPSFLAQVPAETLRGQLAAIRGSLGAFVRVDTSGQRPRVVFERGALDVTAIQLDERGLITSLVVAPVQSGVAFRSFDEARSAFAALPGSVSLLVREVGSTSALAALHADRTLAVGSTFKLAILGELQAQIAAGRRTWTDLATLTPADKSLPSGTLQNAPDGSTYTLRDLATRMIAESDNTATDVLLRVVGRGGVEARLGQPAMPSAREAFALKNPANAALLAAYRASANDVAARRAALARAATAPLPSAAAFADGPLATDVEWFVSTARACDLMAAVAALPEASVNPGLASPNDFARVSFKGGSEPGVLNLTTQVTNRAGKSYCVSATWNDARPLDDNRFYALYSGVLNLLR